MQAQMMEILAGVLNTNDRSMNPFGDGSMGIIERYGAEYERPITNRWIGSILRKKLNLQTYKSHGVYVIPMNEKQKVELMCGRYNVNVITDVSAAEGDEGTTGTL